MLQYIKQGWGIVRSLGGGIARMTTSEEQPDEITRPLTPYDRFINAISRLPRLLMLFGAIACLVWPIYRPDDFIAWARALEVMPENVWLLIFMVFSSWAATKAIRDFRGKNRKGTTFGAGDEQGGYGGGYSDYDYRGTGRFRNLGDTPIGNETDSHNQRIEEWKNKLP